MIENVIIIGAAGRDFHNFNVYFKHNKNYKVVCFTASQIPGIEGRKYPKELSGRLYPNGIPIYSEFELKELIRKYNVTKVVLAYSDLKYEEVMHKSAIVNAAGADFILMGWENTMLASRKKVIAIGAVRTGCGKSSVTQEVVKILKKHKLIPVVIRHPMPYGDLVKQRCQVFTKYSDLRKYNCTIEEREEYEPHIEQKNILLAGVDYEMILRKAEQLGDVIVWDGGNNDFPFIRPNLMITLVDPHRPGHEKMYYPGEVNVRIADVIIINKEKSAKPKNIKIVENNIKEMNPKAIIIHASSEITVKKPMMLKRKKVLVVEDGPTLTHGGMKYGAGYITALKYGARVVSPERYAVGSIKEIFKKFKHLRNILPAMGYNSTQLQELEETINKTKCDVVIDASPAKLSRFIKINKPIVHVNYKIKELGKPTLEEVLKRAIL